MIQESEKPYCTAKEQVEKLLQESRINKCDEKFTWHKNHSKINITRKAFEGAQLS